MAALDISSSHDNASAGGLITFDDWHFLRASGGHFFAPWKECFGKCGGRDKFVTTRQARVDGW
jgi:hypothetical protein